MTCPNCKNAMSVMYFRYFDMDPPEWYEWYYNHCGTRIRFKEAEPDEHSD